MMPIQKLYQLFKDATGITTDSRNISDGVIFFALKGDKFDGNRYAEQSLLSGASYAVVDDPELKGNEKMIWVENVLSTLQTLANYHRKQFDIPVLAITGSNGKTTTKELLATILKSHYRTHFTKGNLNNHIGVPLTLLKMTLDTEIAIIEMGANHIGEIAFLCEIAEPTHGVITNVGKAHLEGFGSFEGVKQGKSELYKFINSNKGVVFINLDEPFLEELGADNTLKVFYQKSNEPDSDLSILETKLVSSEPKISIGFLSDSRETLIEATSNLFGVYNFNNIQTAVSIGRYFKVPSIKVKEAIENYISTNNRSQLLKKGTNTILLDAYNANPTSMRIALDNLVKMPSDSKIVIIGDMLELGTYSKREHQAILDHIIGEKFNKIILVGKEFQEVFKPQPSVFHFPNVEELRNWYIEQEIENATILLKGSRGIGLEKLFNDPN